MKIIFNAQGEQSNGIFFSAKKMSPSYKVHKKKLMTNPVIMEFFI